LVERFPCNSRGSPAVSSLPRRTLSRPGNPRTCPQHLAPGGAAGGGSARSGEAALESRSGFRHRCWLLRHSQRGEASAAARMASTQATACRQRRPGAGCQLAARTLLRGSGIGGSERRWRSAANSRRAASGEKTLADATTARARTVRAPAAPRRSACLPCRNGR
jgi:hypothetical protein